ncbi:MAG: amidohydrolase [Tissierellia bacterium]|nr:amidohydrolase [Tissierellia bacterium]
MDIKERIEDIFHELVEIRRDFHMHPELSLQEYRTSEKISEYLNSWGIEHVKGIAGTGVMAIIRGKREGRTVAARADMDALPILEKNNLPFKSRKEGVMHACGHDIHIAIHLGVAKIIKDMEDQLEGNVKIFFQPAEETVGGAKMMIDEGCLKDPDVDYILALHLDASLEVGHVRLKYGKLNAASSEVYIRIKGKSGHAAYPESTVDSIVVAAYVITALQTLVSRNISPVNSLVLTLGQISGGTKNNVIAGEVNLSGTLRTLDSETQDFAKRRIREIVENTARGFGAEATIEFVDGYPEVVNNEEVVDVLRKTAERLFGKSRVKFKEHPSMGADDFAFFCKETKAAYYNIGCANRGKGWTAPLHSEHFIADEDCIKVGVLLQVETLLELLKN